MFGIGAALQRGIAFLLLPAYTRALAPAEYGRLSVLLAITSAASILLSCGLDMGLFRSFFLYADQPARKRIFLGSIWRFLIIAPVSASVVLAALAAPFVHGIRQVTPLDLFLALLAGAFFVGATAVPLVVMRVEQRLRDFMVLAVVDAVATPALTLLLVVVLHGGIAGWLAAAAGSNAILLVAAIIVVPWDRGVQPDREMVRSALRFGATLIPHAFAFWALLLIDRGVIAGIVSARQLGIYSLAANVGVPVAIAVQSLNQAMMPTYANAGINREHRDHLSDVVVTQVTVLVLICLTGALLGGPLLLIMAPAPYHAAAPLVAWIVLGYAFLGLYFIPMNGITLGAGKSGYVWIVSMLGAASNVALLLIFVPKGGITAAAIASAAAYFVLFVCVSVYACDEANPVRYKWAQLLPVVAAGCVVYVAARLTTPSAGVLSIACRIAWIGGLTAVFVAAYLTRRSRAARHTARAAPGRSDHCLESR